MKVQSIEDSLLREKGCHVQLDLHSTDLATVQALDGYLADSSAVASVAWVSKATGAQPLTYMPQVTKALKARLMNLGGTRDTSFKLYGVTASFQNTVFDQFWKVPQTLAVVVLSAM